MLIGAMAVPSPRSRTRTAMKMSSHPLSRALPSRRIDGAARPLPALLLDALDAGNSRFHAANAGRIAMTTPLTDRVMLIGTMVAPSLRLAALAPWFLYRRLYAVQ